MKFYTIITAIFLGFAVQTNAQKMIDNQFFDQVDAFFKTYVEDGLVKYDQLKNNAELKSLTAQIADAKVDNLDANTTQAFYVNSYNLLVINGILEKYPINSVLKVNGFFDSVKRNIAGEQLTLNQIEKKKLLKVYKDARFHFVLVCGAKGCPPITNFAYRPNQLESQFQKQTNIALNNSEFVKVNRSNKSVQLSQIFNWYNADFGGGKAASIKFINRYRTYKIDSDYKVSFYEYDWTINDLSDEMGSVEKSNGAENAGSNNATRYVTSAAIPKGSTESRIFNNLYTQKTGTPDNLDTRSTFFTQSWSFLYGFTGRFNAGFDLRYRRVRNSGLPSSALDVLKGGEPGTSRNGITAIGPRIRWAPTAVLPNFSIQSTFSFPVGDDLEGSSGERPYADWDGPTWNTQLFNDFSIGDNFSFFTEVDVIIEDIGGEDDLNRFSTPATLIFSYFPNPKTTIYALSSYSPYWQENFDYFAQAGAGVKYQITYDFEVELLYTAFTNQFLQETGGQASTFNIGLRYSR